MNTGGLLSRAAWLWRLVLPACFLVLMCPAARGDQVTVNANVAFGASGTCPPCLTFTAQFVWDSSLQTIVTGTMQESESEPGFLFALSPFAAPTAGGTPFNFANALGDVIQIDFFRLGGLPLSFPTPGEYGPTLVALNCSSLECRNDFGPQGYIIADAGTLTVTPVSTAEPATVLLATVGLVALVWRRLRPVARAS